MEKIKKYVIYFIALNLIILGIDKFFTFIPAACSLLTEATTSMSYSLGVIEILLGILLFAGKFTKTILIFVVLLMISAIIMHLMNDTYDIGAAIFMAIIAIIPLVLPTR